MGIMDWAALLAALIGVLAGGVVTYVTTRSQLKIEAANSFDKSLRELRLPHYRQLFHISRALPRSWRGDVPPDRAKLQAIREEFHCWYFNEQASGMFLSESARQAYFQLQNGLERAANPEGHHDGHITEAESVSLRKLGSDLRHELTADLGGNAVPRGVKRLVPRSVPSARPGLQPPHAGLANVQPHPRDGLGN